MSQSARWTRHNATMNSRELHLGGLDVKSSQHGINGLPALWGVRLPEHGFSRSRCLGGNSSKRTDDQLKGTLAPQSPGWNLKGVSGFEKLVVGRFSGIVVSSCLHGPANTIGVQSDYAIPADERNLRGSGIPEIPG
jgi:hypothetical protein